MPPKSKLMCGKRECKHHRITPRYGGGTDPRLLHTRAWSAGSTLAECAANSHENLSLRLSAIDLALPPGAPILCQLIACPCGTVLFLAERTDLDLCPLPSQANSI